MRNNVTVYGFELQAEPRVYLTALPGKWLLRRATPSWRIKDPEKGFQRVVKEERAKDIATTVLDEHRTFPNAIVLATNKSEFEQLNGKLTVPGKSRFLVVDGQHRLWAQRFSDYEAQYACLIHMGLTEIEMAKLFLEINDNQKRVPSSLRWDLVRLVRPEDDPHGITATELILELATDKASPLFQRIDLTGEQSELSIKQGSLAPEIKSLVSSRSSGSRELDFEKQHDVLVNYLTAIKSLDGQGWRSANLDYSRRMRKDSHRVPRTWYRSGVETFLRTTARRLDGYRLYNSDDVPVPAEFQARARALRRGPRQFGRGRRPAQSDRCPAPLDGTAGRHAPRSPASGQDPASGHRVAAPARVRRGLWLRRLQRRRPAGRRSDPQAAGGPRSAHGRGARLAAHAVAVRE